MKTAMMTQQVGQRRSTYAPNQYLAFARDGTLPLEASVFVASMGEANVSVFSSSATVRRLDGEEGDYFSATLWLGRLLIRVDGGTAIPLLDVRRARASTGMVEIHPSFGAGTLPILEASKYARVSIVNQLDLVSADGRALIV